MPKLSQHLPQPIRFALFFLLGALGTALVLGAAIYLFFTYHYQNRIFTGVRVNSIDVSDLTKVEAKNRLASLTKDGSLTIGSTSGSLSEVDVKPDTNLMVDRAFSVGRQNNNPYWNLLQIYSAWQGNINLPLELSLDDQLLKKMVAKEATNIEKTPIDAVFEFNETAGPDAKGRVSTFKPSSDGLAVDYAQITSDILSQAKQTNSVFVPLYTKVVHPSIQTSAAEKYGLHDHLGSGESYFYDSIPGRVYNINLGTQKVSGSLIAPGDTFSFNDSIGTISALFGFQKAYSIIKGKTVLDDGGGVCQVSTTLYRAALNSGLPIVERAAHAYRVGFYEQGGFKPGMDATVYPPSPDFKFKNDTGHWLLIQATFDDPNKKLTFDIFGTDDGRLTKIEGPVILSQTPAPEPITEDDPTKPNGTITQVDTAHPGAKTSFTRTVTRGNETLINETVVTNYIPWPARFLKGTKT